MADRVQIIYTPFTNLKKTGDMAVGQVAFHNDRKVKRGKFDSMLSLCVAMRRFEETSDGAEIILEVVMLARPGPVYGLPTMASHNVVMPYHRSSGLYRNANQPSNRITLGSLWSTACGSKDVLTAVKISTRDNAIVNRLNKTKVEREVDHEAERQERQRAEGRKKKNEAIERVSHSDGGEIACAGVGRTKILSNQKRPKALARLLAISATIWMLDVGGVFRWASAMTRRRPSWLDQILGMFLEPLHLPNNRGRAPRFRAASRDLAPLG